MRLIFVLLILVVVACGALFGALNGARIAIDFQFAQVEVPTGIALLVALLAGWLLGGLVAWFGHARLRRELRALRRRSVQPAARTQDAP